LSSAIPRPSATRIMGKLDIGHYPPCPPHRSFGDYLHGNLYYPVNTAFLKKDRLPVVIFLHGYAHATGFVQGNTDFRVQDFFEGFVYRGFVVFAFDLIGFGTRIEEGTRFYERYPHWSKMGKMVVDIRAAVEALSNLDLIDPDRIFVVGYSLGGTLALYAAALDDRVAGVASVCGVTPMRLPQDRGQEGLRGYSHLHGLMPRLGFFVGHEKHLPYDFDELLACIAPRPMLVVAPTWDQDACLDEVESCVRHGREVYGLCGAAQNLELYTPDDYNRFSPKVQERVLNWVETLNP
jgi:dienelactone hydrolase